MTHSSIFRDRDKQWMSLKGLHHQVCFVSFRPTKEECYLLWWWDLVKKSIFLLTFLLRIWFVGFFLEANWKKALDGFMSMALFGWEALLSFCVISERVKSCTCCGVRRVAHPHVVSLWATLTYDVVSKELLGVLFIMWSCEHHILVVWKELPGILW
jgi:hypothetical protein